jgi:uncharacterized protein YbjT (DUF2867 family)
MKIVVIGGTGLIGRQLIPLLQADGHEALAASPSTGVDTVTGAGLDDALASADVVVDVTNSPSFADDDVMAFFRASTGNLLAAEERAGAGRHVAVSIVGAHGLPESGYLRAKVAQEELITGSGRPYSLLRATQFMEFLRGIADAATVDGVVRVPAARIQPIASRDVVAALYDVVVDGPENGIVEVGGPEALSFEEAVRRRLAPSGDAREIVADPEARYFGTRLHGDELVAGEGARHGAVTLAEWLRDDA